MPHEEKLSNPPMPVLDFQHEESGEIISVLVPLAAPDKDRHVQEQDGKVYKRVYAAPLAAHDTKAKDGTYEDFTRVVANKKMSVGEAWKISKEMSEYREHKQGTDPVKESFYKEYAKNMGSEHPDVTKRKRLAEKEKLYKEMGLKIE